MTEKTAGETLIKSIKDVASIIRNIEDYGRPGRSLLVSDELGKLEYTIKSSVKFAEIVNMRFEETQAHVQELKGRIATLEGQHNDYEVRIDKCEEMLEYYARTVTE